jgi:hypothetical protein
MPWTSKSKDISITSQTDHPSKKGGVIARPPGVTTINFTPAEFFGAAARCSYTHLVNPALVTPEFVMVKALVEQHVDDTSTDFAVLNSADTFKDYVKSYFSGTIASGVAYLAMIKDGYTWSDHFENIGGGNPGATRLPDFVFARHGQGDVALVESKGTRSDTSSGFNARVNDGYTGQLEPHLGYTVGTSTASHGYCIGSYLKSPTKGELNVHYTDVVAATPAGGPGAGPGSNAAVQRHNYATAFRLAHSETLARQVRQGRIEDQSIPFAYFEWLGRRWLTARVGPAFGGFLAFNPAGVPQIWDLSFVPRPWEAPTFAVESTYALNILRTLSLVPERAELGFDLAPFDPRVMRAASLETSGGAAIFPDGLAVIIRGNVIKETHPIMWMRDKGDFMPAGSWRSPDFKQNKNYLAGGYS